jgi:pimeloyl-ACP methyl ester carboxylesterase
MKRLNLYIFCAVIAFGLLSISCKKNNDLDSGTSTSEDEYYISSTKLNTLTVSDITSKLNDLSSDVDISSLITIGVDVYKVVYKTTFKSNSINASGLVCFPKVAGNYPVLSFQNGTNTLYSEAPSENPDADTMILLESMASLGYIVVIPDYIGFGESASITHPYLDAESSNQSILDMLRATKELGNKDEITAKPTKNLFIFGYSQGGWATLQLQKAIETKYSSEFSLVASSCGSGPYSVEDMTSYVLAQDEYPMPYFLAYVLNSAISNEFISNSLSDFFQEPYASKIPSLFDGKHSGAEIDAELTTKISSLLTSDFINNYLTGSNFAEFRSLIKSNSVTAWSLSTPTKLYHGTADVYIPYSISETMFSDFESIGSSSKIQLVPIKNADHTTAVASVAAKTIIWFYQLNLLL